MSADNWRECPRCLARAVDRCKELEAGLHDAYGTVPATEYDDRRTHMVKQVGEAMKEGHKAVMREDYQLGLSDDGTEFFVSYSAACTCCGAEFEFSADCPVRWGTA